MKKALVHAHTAYHLTQFNMDNIRILQDLGYEVDAACSFADSDSAIEPEEALRRREVLEAMGVHVIETASLRKIYAIGQMRKAYKTLKNTMERQKYDIIHTQTPIGGVICRLAAKKSRKQFGTKVIYEAHGFHFFDGAPKKNWLLYYNAEKYCSKFTDILITINHEDYENATRNFMAQRVEYVPGVGVNLNKFILTEEGRAEVRAEQSIESDETVLLSLGELIPRKNHATAIKAIKKLKDEGYFDNHKIKYLIAGRGRSNAELRALIKESGLRDEVKLLGFRTDVRDVMAAADVYLFPSFQEGLPVALMEAMCCNLPVVASRIRGNVDLIEDGKGGYLFDPESVEDVANKLKMIIENKKMWSVMGFVNRNTMTNFSTDVVEKRMKEIYQSIEVQ